ncbi:uncharacterized protein LOC110894896 [Helianthus annuus]|uniref:uncharacterized protein LOC110894896 n=1 Tax=Helianthus annuus TaxID=4232 RepID=UPI000B8F6341|nr:uncharacterized protein LOC110894896 [Helianthus annuus]
MNSSGTGESDTTGPMPIVSDDRESTEHEVHTSDVTSTDEDDFQPFALPDVAAEPADAPFAGDLPLMEIPAPIPLAAYPVLDMLLDADADDDVDLFGDEPLEDDIEGEALIADGGLLLLTDAPPEESPAHSPVPDSLEFVASVSSHTQGAQHYSHDSDPDRASSAAPAPSYAFDHDLDEDSDPVFPPGFDPDQDIEACYGPEPVAAPDPVFEHDPIHAGVPIVDPVIADLPVDDNPVDAPLLEGDHVVVAAQADAPLIADVPVDPIVAPLPDPVPLEPDHVLFMTHIDPRYAHTQNGWIDADDELPPFPPHTTNARHMDFPSSFAQFTPPA